MKKLILIILVSFIFNKMGNAQEYGRVYFMRFSGYMGSAGAFRTFIDDQLVCRLNNNRYSIHEVEVGKHSFSVQYYGKNVKSNNRPITIEIEPGKTYYIQIYQHTKYMEQDVYCLEMTENSALTILPILKEDPKCLEKINIDD